MGKGTIKTVTIIMMIIVCLTIVGLLGLLVVGLMGVPIFKGMTVKNENGVLIGGGLDYKLYTDEVIEIGDITKIITEYQSDGITIFYHDNDTVRLMEYMSFEPTPEQLAKVSRDGGTLSIKGGERPKFSVGVFMVKVELYLPESYRGALETRTSSGPQRCEEDLILTDFTAQAASGSIKYGNITADNVTISTSSGSIKTDEIYGKVELSAVSGSISCTSIEGETINLQTTSGSLRVDEIKGEQIIDQVSGSTHIGNSVGNQTITKTSGPVSIDNFDGFQNITTSSGTIRCLGGKGSGNYKSTSGSITVEFENCPSDNVTMTGTSGSLKLTIPENSGFNFAASSSSGSVGTFFDSEVSTKGNTKTATIGEPIFDLDMSTTSGNIRVSN